VVQSTGGTGDGTLCAELALGDSRGTATFITSLHQPNNVARHARRRIQALQSAMPVSGYLRVDVTRAAPACGTVKVVVDGTWI